MRFVVDSVSEYSYFENILLGLRRVLDSCEGIVETSLEKLSPLTFSEISVWEQKNGVLLPEEIRLFYSSSNGYLFEWIYAFSVREHENSDENVIAIRKETAELDINQENYVKGRISINPISKLVPIYGHEVCKNAEVSYKSGRYNLTLSPESKIFLLDTTHGDDKIVLVYLYSKYVPTIWMMTSSSFYYLADDISTYLRMAIVHLGIPNWQLIYTPHGVPIWTENLFRILAPHLLPFNNRLEVVSKAKSDHGENFPTNKLNSNLFKVRFQSPPAVSTIQPPQNDTPKPIRKKRYNKHQRKPLYHVKK